MCLFVVLYCADHFVSVFAILNARPCPCRALNFSHCFLLVRSPTRTWARTPSCAVSAAPGALSIPCQLSLQRSRADHDTCLFCRHDQQPRREVASDVAHHGERAAAMNRSMKNKFAIGVDLTSNLFVFCLAGRPPVPPHRGHRKQRTLQTATPLLSIFQYDNSHDLPSSLRLQVVEWDQIS
jgi:hypothetical protein